MKTLQSPAYALILSIQCAALEAAVSGSRPAFQFNARVLDSADRPVPGAVVERYEAGPEGLFAPGDLKLAGQATADADGAIKLPLSSMQTVFLARKAGFAPAWQQSWNPQGDMAEQRLVLTAPSTLAGTVVDESGKAVSGAQVFVLFTMNEVQGEGNSRRFNYLTGKLARDTFQARTGEDGRFRIDGFPTNAAAVLGVQASGKALRQEGGPGFAGPESLPWRGGDQEIKLVLEPAGAVEGKVIAQEGDQPLGGVHLWLNPEQPGFFGQAQFAPAESATDGTFRVSDLSAGSYRLRAVFATNGAPEWVAENVPVVVESGQTTKDVRVLATRGGLLEVSVVRKGGREPVPDVNINAYTPQGYQGVGVSGTNGIAILRLPVGDYQVVASRSQSRADLVSASIQPGQTNRTEIELAPPARVTGTARMPDGQPAAGLEVRIVGGFSAEGVVYPKTDKAGHFETEWDPRRYGRPDMRYALLVRDPEHNLAAVEELEEEGGTLELKLAPALTLAGRVQSLSGQPITNATVGLLFRTGNAGMFLNGLASKTNLLGRFEIPALPPGYRYGISVSAPGYGQTMINEVATDAPAGRVEIDPVELKPANLKLAGQVLDSDEKPVSGVNVFIHGEGQPNGNARTDRQGRFSFAAVCEGTVQISANSPGAFGNVTAEGGDTNVVLRLGQNARFAGGGAPKSIKGTVVDPEGKPVAGARVSMFPSFGFGAPVRTGTNGMFNLTWSPEPWQAGGGSCIVARDAARNLAVALEVDQDSTTVELKLKPGGVVTGRVEDINGAALAKATLELMLEFGRGSSPWGEGASRVDAQGNFELKCLPVGARYQLFASAPGFGRHHEAFEVEDSATPRLSLATFALKPANLPLAGRVLNEDEKPVSGAQVQLTGDDQPQAFTATDRQGRFKLQVCEGSVQLFVHRDNSFTQATLDAGDTNAVITLTPRSRPTMAAPARRSLQGSALPDLAAVGLSTNTVPVGKPALLCLLDCEQRPSRRALRQLTDQHASLSQKGIAVAAVQATVMSDETWQSLKDTTVPFPIGRVSNKSPQNRWATGIESLPWLILIDKQGRVAAEGFGFDELETKLKAVE